MSKQPIIPFALVGYGHIGKRYAHLLAAHPNTELVAICDVMPVSDAKVPVYNTLTELFAGAGGKADVVVIATPNGLHAAQGIEALTAGKHIICEKPMALNTDDCGRMIQAAQQVAREIFCVMQNRFSPPALWLKDMVASGKLGDIIMVRTDCFWNRDERYYTPDSWRGTTDLDGGTLFTQFSHFVDLLLWIFGDLHQLQGDFGNFTHQNRLPFEDTGTLQFRWNSGGIGVLNYSTAVWDKNLESSITVIGSKGSIQIAGQYINEVKYCHVDGYTFQGLPPGSPPNEYGGYQGSASNHHFVIDNVVDVLLHAAKPAVSAEEGRKVVEVIQRMYNQKDSYKTVGHSSQIL
jgi:UDP-N-acetyl-2-amino-2-deoxyglucuronate dehydrogenase